MKITFDYSMREANSINNLITEINNVNKIAETKQVVLPFENKYASLTINRGEKAILMINEDFFIDSLSYLTVVYNRIAPLVLAWKNLIKDITPFGKEYYIKWFQKKDK